MTESPFKGIYVQLQNGMMVPINELPKEHYEYFLSLTTQIRCAYTALKRGNPPAPDKQPQNQIIG